MDYLIQFSLIKACFLSLSFSHCFDIILKSSNNSLSPFIYRQTVKQNGKIEL